MVILLKTRLRRVRHRRQHQVRAVRWTVGTPPRPQDATLFDPLAG